MAAIIFVEIVAAMDDQVDIVARGGMAILLRGVGGPARGDPPRYARGEALGGPFAERQATPRLPGMAPVGPGTPLPLPPTHPGARPAARHVRRYRR